jgi:hypothetical protein
LKSAVKEADEKNKSRQKPQAQNHSQTRQNNQNIGEAL